MTRSFSRRSLFQTRRHRHGYWIRPRIGTRSTPKSLVVSQTVTRLLCAGAVLKLSQAAASQASPLVAAAANQYVFWAFRLRPVSCHASTANKTSFREKNGLSAIVGELIKQGAPVNLPDRNGTSPLATAFEYSKVYCPFHFDHFEEHREKQVFLPGNRRIPDRNEGGCPELRACVDLLLQHGADPNQADGNGNTPLAPACAATCFREYLGHRHDPEICITGRDKAWAVPLMLQHGGDPNARLNPVAPKYAPGHYPVKEVIPVSERETRRWPLTAVQHAYWNADFEVCHQLFDASITHDTDVLGWMFRLALADGV